MILRNGHRHERKTSETCTQGPTLSFGIDDVRNHPRLACTNSTPNHITLQLRVTTNPTSGAVLSGQGARSGLRLDLRRGYVNILELLFVLPFLLLLLLAMVEFSIMLTMQTRLSAAAHEGVREAATGGSPRQVRRVVRRVLGTNHTRHARVRISPEYNDQAPLIPGEPVEVRVVVKAKSVVPDLLSVVGFSLRGKQFIGQAVMRVE
ncbi:MAG: TadE/TadG family type IV pilus assembly protein [Gemmataceae bacterium]